VGHATRICPKCSTLRDSSEWSPGQSYCKPCFREYKQARQAAKIAALPPRQCAECGSDYRSPYSQTLMCSMACATVRAKRLRGTPILSPIHCAVCSTEFMPRFTYSRFCSKKCKEKERWRRRASNSAYVAHRKELAAKSRAIRHSRDPIRATENVRRYRALKRNAFTVPFTNDQLAARMAYWGYRCWMCSGPATSLDHVKPLNKGGAHLLANFRPACARCNASKGDRWYGASHLSRFLRE